MRNITSHLLKKLLLKNYIRFLIFKIYNNQNIYNNIIGTTLLYCDILPFLYKKGYNFLAEIGTGDFSIPALSIKASFLRKKIKYIGLDQRDNKLIGLEIYLKNIGIEYDLYKESFNINNRFINKYGHAKGILCFEHSLDDIIIGKLVQHLGFTEDSDWGDIISKCNDCTNFHNNYKLVHHYSEKLFAMITEAIFNKNIIIIIHHYLRPFCDDNSFLRNLDRIIITCINDLIEGKNFYDIKFRPNFFKEVFWVGGF